MASLTTNELFSIINRECDSSHYSKNHLYNTVKLIVGENVVDRIRTLNIYLNDHYNLTEGEQRKVYHHLAYICQLPSVVQKLGTKTALYIQAALQQYLYMAFDERGPWYICLVEHELFDQTYYSIEVVTVASDSIARWQSDYLVNTRSHIVFMIETADFRTMTHAYECTKGDARITKHETGHNPFYTGDKQALIQCILRTVMPPPQQPSTTIHHDLYGTVEALANCKIQEAEKRYDDKLYKMEKRFASIIRKQYDTMLNLAMPHIADDDE